MEHFCPLAGNTSINGISLVSASSRIGGNYIQVIRGDIDRIAFKGITYSCQNSSQFSILLVLQFVHEVLQCQIGMVLVTSSMLEEHMHVQSLKYKVRHMLQFVFGLALRRSQGVLAELSHLGGGGGGMGA